MCNRALVSLYVSGGHPLFLPGHSFLVSDVPNGRIVLRDSRLSFRSVPEFPAYPVQLVSGAHSLIDMLKAQKATISAVSSIRSWSSKVARRRVVPRQDTGQFGLKQCFYAQQPSSFPSPANFSAYQSGSSDERHKHVKVGQIRLFRKDSVSFGRYAPEQRQCTRLDENLNDDLDFE